VSTVPRASLRFKLLAVMLLTTLVALVVALGAMISYELRAYHEGAVSEMSVQVELLARTTAPALAFDDARVARENLGFLRFQPRVQAAAVYDARGRLFASYSAAGQRQPLPALPGADRVVVEEGDLVVFKRIVDERQILGTVYLRADYALEERLALYAGIAALVALAAMLVALAVSSWLQRIVMRPILAVGEVARDVVERQDYSQRVVRTSNDEVGTLVDAFNNMLSEIDRRTKEALRLNEELERRVHERTAQLEVSNRELALATVAAESANQAKSEFLSNMSHELRTPLNAIIGFGNLLASETRPPTREQQRSFVDHIVRAGEHLLVLINEVLNLAQIEAGKLSMSIEPVELDEVLADCRTLTESQAAERGIRLLLPSNTGVTLMADRMRLKQVLLNLLSNGIKYNRPMGAVVLSCTWPAPRRVRISVQDTGVGLGPAQLEALFMPFNRLGRETGPEQGTGIGLVVTKRLIELMDGQIGVSSGVGTGSVFWIELNARAAAVAPEQPPAPIAPDDGSRSTLLCVEDNPSNLRLVQELLAARPDLRLICARDGREGVEMARAQRPDVILMDNNMPGMTGREAQAVLHGDPQTAGIPVIALTANAMPGAAAQGLAAGFFRYLTKPLDPDQLMNAIDAALELVRSREASQN
jgi:signal transduction histidine kinase/CheY-like chemotaxis protein